MDSKIVKNSVWNFARSIATVLFPLIAIPYVSRNLGVENLGKVNFANSFVGYFILLASLGVETYAMKECSKLRGKVTELERTASEIFSINIVTMIGSYALLIGFVTFCEELSAYANLIYMLSFMIFFSVWGAEWLNLAFEDFAYITKRTFLVQIISLSIILLFVREHSDYYRYAFVVSLSAIIPGILNSFYRKKFCKVKFVTRLNFSKHIKPILLMFSLLLAQSIMSNIDITMLELFFNDTAVGLYSMAVKIYITVERIISSLAYVLIPGLARCFANDNYNEINLLLSNTMAVMLATVIPAAAFMFVLSEEIMIVVCGAEFAAAANCLKVLSLVMVINIIGGSFWGNLVLLPSNNEKYFMYAWVISAGINVVLNSYIIPIYGIEGAAFTTLFSVFIVLCLCKYFAPRSICIDINLSKLVFVLGGSFCIIIMSEIFKYMADNVYIRVAGSSILGIIGYILVLFIGKHPLVIYFYNKIKDIV